MNEILNFELIHFKDTIITVGNILAVVLVLLITQGIIKLLGTMLRRTMRKRLMPDGRQSSLLQLLAYIFWTFGIIIALQSLGLDITFIMASSAALLVGIGLGLQNVFKDFISGIIILLDGTVKSGDVVQVGGWVVKVQEVSLRSSTVMTREDNVVIIPNHKFIEENVINWTFNEKPSRFIIDVGVDYSSDIHQVEKVLLDTLKNRTDVLLEAPHKPFVRLSNFGASSLDFQLIFWSEHSFRIESILSQIRFTIVDEFNKHNITIPFTQVVLHNAEK
ncbi:MAG: mechanosensitive ion channel [Lewinellaceae bacterium]|nr:mechanosensitive ion channel [Saprospiraceae bacterium]MCB9342282.1 mechanosensitive ion channel [Lewinellaceae bacterium]